MNIQDYILDNGLGLAEEETTKGLTCPMCNGGDHGDTSFYITRKKDGYVYLCHRAKCRFSGFLPSDGRALQAIKPKPVPNWINYNLKHLTHEQQQFIENKFPAMDTSVIYDSMLWCSTNDRYYIDLLDAYGRKIGVLARSFEEGVKPKALVHFYNGNHQLSFAYNQGIHEEIIVLTEDIFSANCFTEEYDAASLSGVGFNLDHARTLLELGYRRVIMALDPDAWGLAAKHKRKYSSLFEEFYVLTWDSKKDPKDMTYVEIKRLFQKIHNR